MSVLLALALAAADDPGCDVSASAERFCAAFEVSLNEEQALKLAYQYALSKAVESDRRTEKRGIVIAGDRTNVIALNGAQSAWRALLESECLFEAIATRPGTDEDLNFVKCEIGRVRVRTVYLRALGKRFEKQ